MIIISLIPQDLPKLKINRLFILSVVVYLFSACSALTPKTAETVKQLADQHQYEKALSLYEQIPSPEQELIDIEALANARELYLTQIITEASKAQQKNNFMDAGLILENGRSNLPSSEKIQAAISKLDTAKQAYTNKHQLQYDEVYARFLLSEAPILDKLEKTQSDKISFIKHYETQLNDRHKLSIIMGERGIAALQAGQVQTAKRQLKLAQGLDSNERWQQALASINKKSHIQAKQKKRKLAKQRNAVDRKKALAAKQHKALLQQLKQRFDKQLSLTQIIAAQKTLAELVSKDDTKTETLWIQTSQKKLDQVMEAQLAADLQRGKQFYSKGQIDEAINVWKSALHYAPTSSELMEHVRRAETFQARYKALTK